AESAESNRAEPGTQCKTLLANKQGRTATGPRAVPARSSHEHVQASDDIPGCVTQRKRCEPGTARGPLFAGAPVLWWWCQAPLFSSRFEKQAAITFRAEGGLLSPTLSSIRRR